jgi:hypothetical protein
MKKYIYILTVVLITISCKAQNPIIPLYNGSDKFQTNNAYYKDVDNDLGKLIGVWIYEDNTTTLKIEIQKLIQHYYQESNNGISYYEDYLIGEYQYKENGNEIINTLSNLSNLSFNTENHNILGSRIIDWAKRPQCDECNPNIRRINLSFYDPGRDYIDARIIIKHFIENGIEKIRATIIDGYKVLPYPDAPVVMRIPFGEYILTKQ